jgi:hypothetical protein
MKGDESCFEWLGRDAPSLIAITDAASTGYSFCRKG